LLLQLKIIVLKKKGAFHKVCTHFSHWPWPIGVKHVFSRMYEKDSHKITLLVNDNKNVIYLHHGVLSEI